MNMVLQGLSGGFVFLFLTLTLSSPRAPPWPLTWSDFRHVSSPTKLLSFVSNLTIILDEFDLEVFIFEYLPT